MYQMFEDIPHKEVFKIGVKIMLDEGYFPLSIDAEDYTIDDWGTVDMTPFKNLCEFEKINSVNEETFDFYKKLGVDKLTDLLYE